MGQFILSAYSGEWNETDGISLQAIASENQTISGVGTALRIFTTPTGTNSRVPAMQIEASGKTIISALTNSASGIFDQYVLGALQARFTIQESTANALTINASLADLSTLAAGKVLIWDSTGGGTPVGGSVVPAAAGTYNNGQVGTALLASLVKVNTTATTVAASTVGHTVVNGDYEASQMVQVLF